MDNKKVTPFGIIDTREQDKIGKRLFVRGKYLTNRLIKNKVIWSGSPEVKKENMHDCKSNALSKWAENKITCILGTEIGKKKAACCKLGEGASAAGGGDL